MPCSTSPCTSPSQRLHRQQSQSQRRRARIDRVCERLTIRIVRQRQGFVVARAIRSRRRKVRRDADRFRVDKDIRIVVSNRRGARRLTRGNRNRPLNTINIVNVSSTVGAVLNVTVSPSPSQRLHRQQSQSSASPCSHRSTVVARRLCERQLTIRIVIVSVRDS